MIYIDDADYATLENYNTVVTSTGNTGKIHTEVVSDEKITVKNGSGEYTSYHVVSVRTTITDSENNVANTYISKRLYNADLSIYSGDTGTINDYLAPAMINNAPLNNYTFVEATLSTDISGVLTDGDIVFSWTGSEESSQDSGYALTVKFYYTGEVTDAGDSSKYIALKKVYNNNGNSYLVNNIEAEYDEEGTLVADGYSFITVKAGQKYDITNTQYQVTDQLTVKNSNLYFISGDVALTVDKDLNVTVGNTVLSVANDFQNAVIKGGQKVYVERITSTIAAASDGNYYIKVSNGWAKMSASIVENANVYSYNGKEYLRIETSGTYVKYIVSGVASIDSDGVITNLSSAAKQLSTTAVTNEKVTVNNINVDGNFSTEAGVGNLELNLCDSIIIGIVTLPGKLTITSDYAVGAARVTNAAGKPVANIIANELKITASCVGKHTQLRRMLMMAVANVSNSTDDFLRTEITGNIDVLATDNVYIYQMNKPANILNLSAGNTAYIKSENDIINVAPTGTSSVTGNSVRLSSDQGSVGSVSKLMNISVGDEALFANAKDNVYIIDKEGDVSVEGITAQDGVAYLKTDGSIISGDTENPSEGDSSEANVSGKVIALISENGYIGATDNRLTIKNFGGSASINAEGDIELDETTEGGISSGSFTSQSGEIDVNTTGNIGNKNVVNNDITPVVFSVSDGQTVNVDAQGDIYGEEPDGAVISDGITSENGEIYFITHGDTQIDNLSSVKKNVSLKAFKSSGVTTNNFSDITINNLSSGTQTDITGRDVNIANGNVGTEQTGSLNVNSENDTDVTDANVADDISVNSGNNINIDNLITSYSGSVRFASGNNISLNRVSAPNGTFVADAGSKLINNIEDGSVTNVTAK